MERIPTLLSARHRHHRMKESARQQAVASAAPHEVRVQKPRLLSHAVLLVPGTIANAITKSDTKIAHKRGIPVLPPFDGYLQHSTAEVRRLDYHRLCRRRLRKPQSCLVPLIVHGYASCQRGDQGTCNCPSEDPNAITKEKQTTMQYQEQTILVRKQPIQADPCVDEFECGQHGWLSEIENRFGRSLWQHNSSVPQAQGAEGVCCALIGILVCSVRTVVVRPRIPRNSYGQRRSCASSRLGRRHPCFFSSFS
jgi:hypothetical protein